MTASITKKLFTVDDYYKMLESGILTADDRVELINGEILQMSPIGSKHSACVKRLNMLFNRLIGDRFIVSIQDPIRINRLSEPEPDVAILRRREDFYAEAHPTPEDVQLLIEVADSTLPTDQKVKLPLYAAAGIPQVWLIDLENERILTYANPKDGAFHIEHVYKNEDAIPLAPMTGQSLSVKAIIG